MTPETPKLLIDKDEQKKLIHRLDRGNWRQRLHANPSNADMKFYEGLERRGLTKGMLTNVQICVIRNGEEHQINTNPESFWPTQGVLAYLDGPPHKNERKRIKDEKIDAELRENGLKPLRFPYKMPLSNKRLKEILDRIEEELKK